MGDPTSLSPGSLTCRTDGRSGQTGAPMTPRERGGRRRKRGRTRLRTVDNGGGGPRREHGVSHRGGVGPTTDTGGGTVPRPGGPLFKGESGLYSRFPTGNDLPRGLGVGSEDRLFPLSMDIVVLQSLRAEHPVLGTVWTAPPRFVLQSSLHQGSATQHPKPLGLHRGTPETDRPTGTSSWNGRPSVGCFPC